MHVHHQHRQPPSRRIARSANDKPLATQATMTLRLPSGRRLEAKHFESRELGGVFAELPESLPFGMELEIDFHLPAESNAIQCKGFVVWSTRTSPDLAPGKTGVGVRLMDISVSGLLRLARGIAPKP